jgi:hypothetical protein
MMMLGLMHWRAAYQAAAAAPAHASNRSSNNRLPAAWDEALLGRQAQSGHHCLRLSKCDQRQHLEPLSSSSGSSRAQEAVRLSSRENGSGWQMSSPSKKARAGLESKV